MQNLQTKLHTPQIFIQKFIIKSIKHIFINLIIHYFINYLPINQSLISCVPAPISYSFASLKNLPVGYSFM